MSYENRFEIFENHRFTQEQFPVGRLVALRVDYDSQTKIIQAHVPSNSDSNLVYLVTVNAWTGECICGCKAFEYNVSSIKGRLKHGVFLEHVAEEVFGKRLWPLITRMPSGLCPHTRKMRLWLKSHDLYKHIETAVLSHEPVRRVQLEEVA